MTGEELIELFNRIDEEPRGKFVMPTTREDLEAFVMLDKLVPGHTDIIGGSEHDVIFIDINVEKLAAVVTEEDVRKLSKLGVHHSEEYDGLIMFT